MAIMTNIDTAEWILNAAIQTFSILVTGVLIVYLMRHKSAPLRSGISLITMLALILLPLFSISLNELNYLPIKTMIPLTLDKGASPSVSVTYDLIESPLDNGGNGKTSPFSLLWRGPPVVKIINILGLIWGVGLLFMLLRLALGAIAIHNLKKGMLEVTDPRMAAVLKSFENGFPDRMKARVFLSQKASYPMAVGIFKPVILIPEPLSHKLKDSQIWGILLHELSHIQHGDLITGVLQRLITALYWWNPLAYTLSRWHSRAREEISDNHVLLQNDSKEYAECLIELAENTAFWKRLSVSVGLASPHIPLKDRVKHILSKERIMETNLKKSTIMVMVVAALLFLFVVAGSRLIFATDKPETTIEKADFSLPVLQKQDGQNQKEQKKSDKQNIIPPKLIKKVEPVYPDDARKAGIEGTVTLEATTDNRGRVRTVKVLNSIPELDQAAIDAVKQWVYEPMIIDGEPYGVVFTTTCRFSLKDGKLGRSYEGGVTGTDQKPAVPAVGSIKPPKLIKKVEPLYPAIAKESHVEGVVILEATTDIYGRIVNTRILRSIPLLDQAAVDAVKQWIYEPMIIDGEPRGIIFTVTCTFKLDSRDEPVRAVGDIGPPRLIKMVEPVYPDEAKKAGIEGVVILEATADRYGRVKNARVLRSIPDLDQAAIDAVKQWVYEPMVIDGKPKGVIFTVTVVFKLN
jgi:TonB family protein